MVNTVDDSRYRWLASATGLVGKSIQDLEWAYYSPLSGLTPVTKYTISDHKFAYWRTKAGISVGTLTDARNKYLDSIGITSGSLDDRLNDYLSNRNLLSLNAATMEAGFATYYTSGFNAPTLSDETVTPISGTKSVKGISTVNAAAWNISTSSNGRTPVTPLQVISGRIKFKAIASRNIICILAFWDSVPTFLSQVLGVAALATGGIDNAVCENITVPANATLAGIIVQQQASGTVIGDTLVFDDAMINNGSTALPYRSPIVP